MNLFKRKPEDQQKINAGDLVTSNGRYPNLKDEYFFNGPLRVLRVEDNTLDYTGGKFVYVEYGRKQIGLYINGLKKLK